MEEKEQYCANYERDNVDPVVEAVRERLLERSQVGVTKYGGYLSDNKTDNFINHALEESMDFCNYLMTLKMQNKDITDLVRSEQNDQILGQKIRKIYGN